MWRVGCLCVCVGALTTLRAALAEPAGEGVVSGEVVQQLPVLLPLRVPLLPLRSCGICNAYSPSAASTLPHTAPPRDVQLCFGSLSLLPRPRLPLARPGLRALLFRTVPGLATPCSLDPLGRPPPLDPLALCSAAWGRASSPPVAAAGLVADGVDGRASPAVLVGVTLPTMRCFGLAQEQVNSSSAASATIPKPVSANITRQNVMPAPSSSRSSSGGDTGAAGADGDGVMGGGWPVPTSALPCLRSKLYD